MKKLLAALLLALTALTARGGEYMTRGAPLAITGATNAAPIVVTTATNNLAINDSIRIQGVGGNTNANGDWICSAVTATTCTLSGSSGNGTYTAATGVLTPYSQRATGPSGWFDVSRFLYARVHVYCQSSACVASVDVESSEVPPASNAPMNAPALALTTIANPTAAGSFYALSPPAGKVRINVTAWTSGTVYAVIEGYRDSSLSKVY